MAGIQALIFDMDGVLIDSNPMHRLSWQEYTRRQGVEATESMLNGMYGHRNDQIVRDFLGEHLDDAAVIAHGQAKEALFREMMEPCVKQNLVPGLREFLTRHRNMPLAVATNAEPKNINFVLGKGDLEGFFPVAVNGSDVTHPKPHPEIYLLAAKRLATPPECCVVFEDSDAGVKAGLAAGMRVVGLSTTHETLPGVSLMIRDFNDPALEPWLYSAAG